LLETLTAFVVSVPQSLDLAHQLVVRDRELPPLRAGMLVEHLLVDLAALLEALRAGDRYLAVKHVGEASEDVAVEDRLLVVAVLGETLDLLALDRHGALVLLDAVAVEDAHFDDRAGDARRDAKRGIADIR